MKTPPKKNHYKHWYVFGAYPAQTLVNVRKASWNYAEFLSEELALTKSCITFKRVPAVRAYALLRSGVVSRGFSAVRSDLVHILALHNLGTSADSPVI